MLILLAGSADYTPLLAQTARPLHIVALLEKGPLPGWERHPQTAAGLTVDIVCAPAFEALRDMRAQFDAIILHELAGCEWARALAKCSKPGTILTAYQLSHAQQAALSATGFQFAPGPGLRAEFVSRRPALPVAPVGERRALIVGAGLAGCAAAQRLSARGWEVALYERHAAPAQEASGNLAGIFMPLLSQDDSVPARLSRAAYLFALRYWQTLGGVGRAFRGAQCGVLHVARDAQHAQAQSAMAAHWQYPEQFAAWLDSGQASAVLGAAVPHGAWLFRQAGWAHPASVCQAMLAACGARLHTHFGVGDVAAERLNGQWQLRDGSGAVLGQAPTLILACGAQAASLAQTRDLPLQRLRGQVSHIDAGQACAPSLVLCREAYLTPAIDGVISAGASYALSEEAGLSPEQHQDNLAKAAAMLPGFPTAAPLLGRVGWRSVAPDRLPLAGALPAASQTNKAERLRDLARAPGLYSLLGYASRGLIWAPLAAELLAAQLNAEPLPLPVSLAEALDPGRFLLRARRRPAMMEDSG